MRWPAAKRSINPPDAVLFPEEEAVCRAVDKRRREFQTVRHCARRALTELGLSPAAVLPGERREPVWPPGVVGSLTHCTGYRAAAVAHRCEVLTVGIDAEPHEPLPPDIADAVALDEELVGLAELTAVDSAVLGSGPGWQGRRLRTRCMVTETVRVAVIA